MDHKTNVRALGLCSGGLDSILSALLLRKQGVRVEWINFETPFFSAEKARRASAATGVPLRVLNIGDEYLTMLKNPRCGYGRNMNPCLDCHALMFKLAGQVMESEGFDFLFSGEVLGQRPMSQTGPSLRYVEKHSGFEGRIVRPLSAKRLPATVPEEQGLIRRDLLLDISGRGRKEQIRLAAEWGVRDYPAPAGGCLLTDKGYSRRLRDLFDHQESCPERDLMLLRHGRHFRLHPDAKLIVGRSRSDNEGIMKYTDPRLDASLRMSVLSGPVALVPGNAGDDLIPLAATICASYSNASENQPASVTVRDPKGEKQLTVLTLPPRSFQKLLI